jgi:hypothetical protein
MQTGRDLPMHVIIFIIPFETIILVTIYHGFIRNFNIDYKMITSMCRFLVYIPSTMRNQNCTKLVRQRNKARNRASHTGRGEDFKNYKEKKKLCKKLITCTGKSLPVCIFIIPFETIILVTIYHGFIRNFNIDYKMITSMCRFLVWGVNEMIQRVTICITMLLKII